jgi:hypothetical protein
MTLPGIEFARRFLLHVSHAVLHRHPGLDAALLIFPLA